MNWLDQDLMYSISMTCIHSLWQGIIILGIVTLLKNQISASKTHLIYWIYMSGMGAMMIAWLTTFTYFLDVSISTISESAAWFETAIFTGSSTTDKLQSNNPIFLLLAYGWSFGTSAFLIKAYLGNRKLIRKRKTGFIASASWQQKVVDLSYKINVKVKVLLKHSKHINIPLVLGVFKPIILIPSAYFSNLTPIQLEAILMHELTHIKRHDYLANTIQVVIESILFYHPVSWFIGKKIRQYREYICDEHVQSNVDTIPYLEALYRIADFSNSNPSPAVTLYNQKNELIMRVKRMLNKPFLDYHLKPIVYISILVIIAFSQYAFRNIQEANTNDIHISLDNLQLHDVNHVESTQSMDPVIASFENLKNLQSSFNNLPTVEEVKDTVPPPEKIEELHQKIEATSRELEKMSEHFSQEMETRMGAKMKELEIKSEQLERELEPKMRAMEEKMNSKEMKDFEKKQVELELRLQESVAKLEERMESKEFKQLEKEIELKSQQLDALEHNSKSEEERRKSHQLQKEIQELSHKLQNQMHDVQMEHQKIMNDPEIKKLQEELKSQNRKMAEIHKKHQHVWNEQTKKLQQEMHQLQQQIQFEMQSLNQDIQNNMELKSRELRELHKELEKINKEQNSKNQH